jgi:SSS family solute:Na+ symporter
MGYIDYAILAIYVLFVLGIGFALKHSMKSSSDFFMSGRAIPAWITGLAFISANLGALELVGMGASGAKYGIATCHFYWVGAIPAMVFLAVFMMPFYYGSKARSVPEYLKLRFDERTRCFNSISFAVMTIMASGISMHQLAKLLQTQMSWPDVWPMELRYNVSLWISSAVVLVYVFKGGLTSAIYTEVLQFCMIVLGFAPVVYLGMKDIGGWPKLHDALSNVAQNPVSVNVATSAQTYAPNAWTSAWQPLLAGSNSNPMGVDVFAMVFGLGFVLAFGYWCTNFLVVQRAMAARNMTAARRTPLIGAVPKMFLPALVILPGMLAIGLTSASPGKYRLPQKPLSSNRVAPAIAAVQAAAKNKEQVASLAEFVAGKNAEGKPVQVPGPHAEEAIKSINDAGKTEFNQFALAKLIVDAADHKMTKAEISETLHRITQNDYDLVITSLIQRYCPPGLLGLALTALLASFMSGMAGNVTAFNTVWTYDLYQAYIAPNRSDAHYLWMGRVVTVVGILLSIGAAYIAGNWNNAMDIIQLVFGFVNAPLFATFLLGMFVARTTGTGAFIGLICGTATSAIFHAMTLSRGNAPGVKGGYLADVLHTTPWRFDSEMAQNFWLACFAFGVCFVLTIFISILGRRDKSDEELKGLVYSLTPRTVDHNEAWYVKPAFLGTILLIVCVVLNIIFW